MVDKKFIREFFLRLSLFSCGFFFTKKIKDVGDTWCIEECKVATLWSTWGFCISWICKRGFTCYFTLKGNRKKILCLLQFSSWKHLWICRSVCVYICVTFFKENPAVYDTDGYTCFTSVKPKKNVVQTLLNFLVNGWTS